jgi:protein-S-isoprenylcysteine O-methyltransferase Ste14
MSTNDHAGVWLPPPIMFVIPLVAAGVVQSVRPWSIADAGSIAVSIGALGLVAAAVTLGLASVVAFWNVKTTILPAGRPTISIVDRGPYRFTRNPMYLAMAVAYAGIAMLLNSVWALGMLPAVVAVVDRFVIPREERYLRAKFGETYVRYWSRVRRWI